MIKSFADRETAALFANQRVRRFNSDWLPTARRKLAQLHHVASLDELRIPPGNRLESLNGTRKGQFSIRINDQWRICFEWRDGHVWNVAIVDYH